ncbi:MAG: MFS transporter [Acidobacteriaceae bacterium]
MTQSSSEKGIAERHDAVSALVLTLGFSLTGAGTLTLGVLLPVLSHKWGLADSNAGLLLFLQFLGSTLGAVLNGKERVRSMAIGYALLVASACALAFAGPMTLFPSYFLFGLGLGMAMTATNLLFSDRYAEDRAAKLERLNFTWSAGAMAAPALLLPFLRGASLVVLYLGYVGLFLLLLLWVLLRERRIPVKTAAGNRSQERGTAAGAGAAAREPATLSFLLPLVLMATCSVGVETALGGWLSTYSHRSHPAGVGEGAFATLLFMLGIVLSRLLFSTSLLERIGRERVLRWAFWSTAVWVALLIAGHDRLLIDAASLLCGLSIGPLYPLLLAFLLARCPSGWIFAAAGAGSAIFPWLTGVISTQAGSLRYGLLAPWGATLLMIVLTPIGLRNARPRAVAAELPTQ